MTELTGAAPIQLRLGASTWTYLRSCSTREAMDRLGAIGFDGFDILTVPPHLWPSEIDAAQRADLRRHMVAAGLRADSLNLPAVDQNLCGATREMRAYTVAQFHELLDLCNDLCVPNIVVVPGRQPSLLKLPQQAAEQWLLEGLEALVPHAERCGVRLLLENHHLSVVPRVSLMAAFLDRFASPHVGIAYDVANGVFAGEVLAGAIATCGEFLGQVHLSDATAERWDHGAIGSGSIDFVAVAALLREHGFAGTSIVEVVSQQPDQDMRQAWASLRANGWG
jgi:L-ribulose-5-phosphate 3-epimerase